MNVVKMSFPFLMSVVEFELCKFEFYFEIAIWPYIHKYGIYMYVSKDDNNNHVD